MRVLHLVKTSVGAAWVYHQVRVLCSLGVEVVVALPSASEGFAPLYKQAGATVVPADLNFPSHYLWRVPAVVAACRKLLRDIKPDIVHSHHLGTAFAMRLAMREESAIPHIFQVPGPLHLEYRALAALDLFLAGPRDYWIATCQWTRRRYLGLGVEPKRVFLTYAGTDVTPFGGARTGLLRAELGIPVDAPLIGMVAYMYAPAWFLRERRGLKGHEDFIRALSLVRQVCPDIRGVIVGGPWAGATRYESYLRDLGKRSCNGFLSFSGHRNDIPQIYPDLDLAVVPSHSENCGGALEPLLSEIPVVATNAGGLPDLVENGRTGWLVPPRKPGKLAEAILEALQNQEEAQRRAREGRSRALRLFDIEKVGRDVEAIYGQILSDPATVKSSDASLSKVSPAA